MFTARGMGEQDGFYFSEWSDPMLMIAVVVLAAWLVLSVPVCLFLGRLMAFGSGRAEQPSTLFPSEAEPDELADAS